jgi:hypothetical protein
MHSACFLLLIVWAMPNKSKESTLMLDMGTLPITMARQYVVWFICADGVDQAKFRVRRALTYFVVADDDMNKLIACHKSLICTRSQIMLKYGLQRNQVKFLKTTADKLRKKSTILVGSKACC